MLLAHAMLILAIAAIVLAVLRWSPETPLRCSCGRPATRLLTDGQLECEDCLERRTG